MKKISYYIILFAIVFFPTFIFSNDTFPLKNGRYEGTWTDGAHEYSLKFNISFSKEIDTYILWTLLKSPRTSEQLKIGFKGKEYVKGDFDPIKRKLSFAGYKKEDPHTIIGLDKYELIVSEDGTKISGKTESGGAWKGIIKAKLSEKEVKNDSINDLDKNEYNFSRFAYIDKINHVLSDTETGIHYRYITNNEIEKYVKPNGFAYFHDSSPQGPVPTNREEYPHLTYNPGTSFIYVKMGMSDFEKYTIENEILKNNLVYKQLAFGKLKLNLNNILGFQTYYNELLKLSKFEVATKRDEINEKLLFHQKPYISEYKKYINSTFVLAPFPTEQRVTEKNYNVDDETLTLDLAEGDVLKSNLGYGQSLLYGKKFRTEHLEKQYKNIPLTDKVKINLSIKDAADFFSKGKKIFYTSHTYVRPVDKLVKSPSTAFQSFEVKMIAIHFINIDKDSLIKSIVLHNFKPIKNTNGHFVNYGWDINIINYPEEQKLQPLNPFVGSWEVKNGTKMKRSDGSSLHVWDNYNDDYFDIMSQITFFGNQAIIKAFDPENAQKKNSLLRNQKYKNRINAVFFKNIRKTELGWYGYPVRSTSLPMTKIEIIDNEMKLYFSKQYTKMTLTPK